MHPFWLSHEEKRVCVRLSIEVAMAGVGAPLMVTWQTCGRGEGEGKRRRQQGARPRGEGCRGGAAGDMGGRARAAWFGLAAVRA
jgi:hypothetical protein